MGQRHAAKFPRSIILSVSCLCLFLLSSHPASGWHDRAHLAVARAAGYVSWYNAAGPDMAKMKFGPTEGTNHWCNNSAGVEVTPSFILDQVKQYNKASDLEGHLYGAIIASIRAYVQDQEVGKYAGYHMAFCAHYIGDLSMPLHNVPYDAFNETRHNANDGTVELGALNNIGLIRKNMYSIVIRDEPDLAREIARIANIARRLASKLREENRDMTQDEAYAELSHSASLLRAVLFYAKRENSSSLCGSTSTMKSAQVSAPVDIDRLARNIAVADHHEGDVSDLLHSSKTADRHKIGVQ